MQRHRHSIILGAAVLAVVALWPAEAQASAVPHTGIRVSVTADPVDPSPYQKGYDKGRTEGYQEGTSRALHHCEDTPGWPSFPEGAYGVGYSEGYMLGWNRGLEDGKAKYCRPA